MSKPTSSVEYISEDLAILGDQGIIVAMATPEPIVAPTSPKPKGTGGSNDDLAVWGDDNDFPQQVIEKAEKSTELPALLDWKARVLQGREVVAVDMQWNAEKKDFDVVRIDDEEINSFLAHRTFKRYWREGCIDFVWFMLHFPDLIKSNGGDKIAYLGVHEASWCRWNKMNKDGVVTKCYVSPNWPDAKPDSENTDTHPVVDPYDPQVVKKVKENSKLLRFVFPAQYSTPGKAYYPLAPWTSFIFSDWEKIARKIPEWKVALMDRVLSAKYILTIPINFWAAAYPDWNKKTVAEKAQIKKAKVDEINKQLTGAANAGKTILSEIGMDSENKQIPAFSIVPIADGVKDGQYLEDSREASEHLMRALNVDPTLVGDGPGKNVGGGSGSDKRIAFNIQVALLQPYREVILEPLYFIAEYNGWTEKYKNLRFQVLEIQLETLDKSHQTAKPTNPTENNGTN